MLKKALLIANKNSGPAPYSRFQFESSDDSILGDDFAFLYSKSQGDIIGSYFHVLGEELAISEDGEDYVYAYAGKDKDFFSFPLGLSGKSGICKFKATVPLYGSLVYYGIYGPNVEYAVVPSGELMVAFSTLEQAQVALADGSYIPAESITRPTALGCIFSIVADLTLVDSPSWTQPLPSKNYTWSFVASEAVANGSFFRGYSSLTHPDSACSVYVNGQKTTQKFSSLTFNADDLVTIEMNGVMSFPVYMGGITFKQLNTPLPFMSDVDGKGIEKLNFSFENMSSLTSVPSGMFANNPSIKTASNLFKGTGLTSAPANLFQGLDNIEDLVAPFMECTSLASIDEGLFNGMDKLDNLSNAFSDCVSLASLPSGLFANNPELGTLNKTFNGCKALTSIPGDLFASNTKLYDFQYTFCHCENVTEIPEGLFKNVNGYQGDNTQSFIYFSHTFNSCYKITSIPKNLFANMKWAVNFSGVFSYCLKLESIPSELFANNPNAKQFGSAFEGCQSSKFTKIPEELFANNLEALNFDFCFSNCTYLTSIPESLFANNTKATSIRGTFGGCKRLTSVPENLFANNVEVTSFGGLIHGLFGGCSALASVPENLFVNNTKVTDFSMLFKDSPNVSCRLKIGSSVVDNVSKFCDGAGAITVIVPAGSLTETTFRDYAATVTNLTVETY